MPRAASAAAAVFLTGALFQAAPARADIVFDFSGTCTEGDCTTVSAILTLADTYTFGMDITAADFISFDYSSTINSFDLTDFSSLFEGGINADGSLPGSGVLDIVSPTYYPLFFDDMTSFAATLEGNPGDVGFGTFTPVTGAIPEPSTWAMLVVGFAGLGFAGYRKARPAGGTSA